MEALIPILIAVVFVGYAIFAIYWYSSRGRRILENWAADNDFTILSSELRPFRRGPYTFRSHKNHAVYHVRVRVGASGEICEGYVRCGSTLWGVMQNEVSVEWIT